MLRKVDGPSCDREIWCVRTNEELNNLDQNVDTATDVKLIRLEWLGHLMRMENNRIPKTVLDAKLDGKGKAGRPNIKWLGDVQAGLKTKRITGWTRKAQGRSEWMDVIRGVREDCENRNETEEKEGRSLK